MNSFQENEVTWETFQTLYNVAKYDSETICKQTDCEWKVSSYFIKKTKKYNFYKRFMIDHPQNRVKLNWLQWFFFLFNLFIEKKFS